MQISLRPCLNMLEFAGFRCFGGFVSLGPHDFISIVGLLVSLVTDVPLVSFHLLFRALIYLVDNRSK